MTIGEMIRKRRKEDGLSQRELSSILGLKDHTMIAKIESGQRFPKSSIPRIAKWLRKSTEEVLNIIAEEKIGIAQDDLEETNNPSFLLEEEIEDVAVEDRKRYLRLSGKDVIELPKDREKIVKTLFGLKVYYAGFLFGPDGEIGETLFGGLFPEGCYYHNEDKIIVINDHQVKGKNLVSEETKTFQIFHEVGHYRLHFLRGVSCFSDHNLLPDRPIYCSSGDKYKALRQVEFQANSYASAFLMPREELKEIIGNRTFIDVSRFEKLLRQHFGVSKQQILLRLQRIGINLVK